MGVLQNNMPLQYIDFSVCLRIAHSMPLRVPRETISPSLLCVADISAFIFMPIAEKYAYVPVVWLSARRASLASGDFGSRLIVFSNSVRALAKSLSF